MKKYFFLLLLCLQTITADVSFMKSNGCYIVGPKEHLIANGTLSSITNNGGRISGNATFGTIQMNAGTIAPGASIGIVEITGDYVQAANAVYEVEVETFISDQIIATGNAIIQNGAVLTVLEPVGTVLQGTTYDILIAANINQLWSQINLPEGLSFILSLEEGNTIARLTVASSSSFNKEFVQSLNSLRVANYINAIEITDNEDLEDVVLTMELDPEGVDFFLDQLHHARFASFPLTNLDNNSWIFTTIQSHLPLVSCKKQTSTIVKQINHAIWLSPIGSWVNSQNIEKLPDYSNTAIGTVLGYDYHIKKTGFLGVATGYLHTTTDWNEFLGSTIEQKSFLSLYGSYQTKRFLAGCYLMGGANFYDTKRRIVFVDIDRTAKSAHLAGFISTRINTQVDLIGTVPTLVFVGDVDYHYLDAVFYEETNADSLNLAIDQPESHLLRGKLGLRLDTSFFLRGLCSRLFLGTHLVTKVPLDTEEFSAKFLPFKENSNKIVVEASITQAIYYLACDLGAVFSNDYLKCTTTYEVQLRKTGYIQEGQVSCGISF